MDGFDGVVELFFGDQKEFWWGWDQFWGYFIFFDLLWDDIVDSYNLLKFIEFNFKAPDDKEADKMTVSETSFLCKI